MKNSYDVLNKGVSELSHIHEEDRNLLSEVIDYFRAQTSYQKPTGWTDHLSNVLGRRSQDEKLYLVGSALKSEDYQDIDLVSNSEDMKDLLREESERGHMGTATLPHTDQTEWSGGVSMLEKPYQVETLDRLCSVVPVGPKINGVAATSSFETEIGPYVQDFGVPGVYVQTPYDVKIQDERQQTSSIHLSFQPQVDSH